MVANCKNIGLTIAHSVIHLASFGLYVNRQSIIFEPKLLVDIQLKIFRLAYTRYVKRTQIQDCKWHNLRLKAAQLLKLFSP